MLRARGIETISADLSHRMAERNPGPCVVLDEEFLPIAPGSVDLIVAHLSLHWVNDLPGALIQMRRALAPDGLLLASLPALGTLAERLDRQPLDHTLRFLGFLATPRNGKGVVFHLQEFQHIS